MQICGCVGGEGWGEVLELRSFFFMLWPMWQKLFKFVLSSKIFNLILNPESGRNIWLEGVKNLVKTTSKFLDSIYKSKCIPEEGEPAIIHF